MAFGLDLRKPFRGNHIIFVGDPAHLPAVEDDIFGSNLFREFHLFSLTDVVRQLGSSFVDILNTIRLGEVNERVEALLLSRLAAEPPKPAQDIGDGAIIVSLRKERGIYNESILLALGQEFIFNAVQMSKSIKQTQSVDKVYYNTHA